MDNIERQGKKLSLVVKIDLAIIVVSIVVLMGLVGYARPLVIAPINHYKSINGKVLFNFTKADVLLIDNNKDFTSPDRYNVVDGENIRLEPGVYYWKVSGILGSKVRKLTIQSVAELKLVRLKDGFGVVNSGNVGLGVDVYSGNKLVGKDNLSVGEVSRNGTKFVGYQDG